MSEELSRKEIEETVRKSVEEILPEVIYPITQSNDVLIQTIAIVSTIIGSAVGIGLVLKQLIQNQKHHNEDVAIQSFEVITGLVDNKESLFYRRIIYSAQKWKYLISNFNSCSPKSEPWEIEFKDIESVSEKLKEFSTLKTSLPSDMVNAGLGKIYNYVSWQTAVNYDNVCFLLDQNSELRDKIIEFHGATILKVYIIIQGLMKRWKEERGRSDHIFFHRIAQHIWENHKIQRKHAIANLITSQEEIFIRKSNSKIEEEVTSIDVIEFDLWGAEIFNHKAFYDKKYFTQRYEYNIYLDGDDIDEDICKSKDRKNKERTST